MLSKSLSQEDIIEDPHKFGLPTFEEFCKNQGQWRQNPEQLLIDATKGSTILRKSIVKISFAFRCWETSSAEKLQSMLADHGLKPQDMKMAPELIYLGNGKCKCIVNFIEKEPRECGPDLSSRKS